MHSINLYLKLRQFYSGRQFYICPLIIYWNWPLTISWPKWTLMKMNPWFLQHSVWLWRQLRPGQTPYEQSDPYYLRQRLYSGKTAVGLVPGSLAPNTKWSFLTIPMGLDGYQTHSTTTTIWEYSSPCIKPNKVFEFL